MKAMYKYELAEAAGVSANTFRRWLNENSSKLARFGVKRRSQMLLLRREWGLSPLCGAAMTFSHCSKDPSRPKQSSGFAMNMA